MPTKKKAVVSPRIAAKAKEVLAFAEEKAKTAADWIELHNALFGLCGKATELFPTEAERAAYLRTPESRRVSALMDTLPRPEPKGFVDMLGTANGAISVRLPRSIHAALLAEAKAEGVSLNQLCLSKLTLQLRAVIQSRAS